MTLSEFINYIRLQLSEKEFYNWNYHERLRAYEVYKNSVKKG